MQLMPSFSPVRVRDARRPVAAERPEQPVPDTNFELLGILQATAGPLTTIERIGNLSTMGELAYSLRHLETADPRYVASPHDQVGDMAPHDADSKALWAPLRDDEPIALSINHDEGLPE